MIVSHRHRFIHIKAHKVAGSSVELALAKHCGPEDIIHPIPEFDSVFDETEYDWPTRNCHPKADQHLPAAGIRDLVGEETWNSYRKIVEVRNPWDMLVSFFFWWVKLDPEVPRTFTRFAQWHCNGILPPVNDSYWLTPQGGVWADSIIRFESLGEDTARVFQELGLEYDGLPRLKTKRPSGTKKIHYSLFYTHPDILMVGRKYRRSIECFGYEFEDRRQPSRRR